MDLRPVSDAAVDLARRMAEWWQSVLGSELIGAYLIGSLAHGGFSARYSDVDMALITETGLSTVQLGRGKVRAVWLSADWGPRLSVFWADRNFSVGRFPPLDRVDYLDHAVMLSEREHVRPPRPALGEIQDYFRGAPFTNWAEQARRFAAMPMLEPKDRKAYLRTLLYPARLCFSFITGRMGSNDEAVAFLRRSSPAALDVDLISRALQCRQADADPDPLFAARTALPSQVTACAAVLA
jgi:predicted nucleotidyltransferase